MHCLLILVFLICPLLTQQSCPSYIQSTIYSSGKITPISSFTTNATSPVTSSLIYTTPLNIVSTPNYYYLALGIVGIQALSSSQLSFNVTITNINQTSFSITTKIIGLTFCNKLSYHYLAISYPLSIMEMLIYFDCFLTPDLSATLYKSASQSFELQNLPFSDGSYVRNIYSVISGMRLINNHGQYFSVSLKSTIPIGTNNIKHTITTDFYNKLEFICMSTIVVSEYSDIKSYVNEIYYDFADVNQVNQTLNIKSFSKFKNQNMQFYGVTSLQLNAQFDISFDFDSSNYTDISAGSIIGSGVSSIILSYMYYAINQMSNYPGKFYVPDTGQCVNGCPTLPGYSVYDSITCQKCYYTCLTCSLPKLNERCDTCDSLVFRTLNTTTNQCDCNSGYVDVAVTICVTCSSIISQCLTCQNATSCTSCSSGFILSYDKAQCLCPSGGSMVNSICLDFLGCLVAKNVTNMVYCETCDEANHFQKFVLNSTCICMNGFELKDQNCVDICGDGNLQNISQGCDDGNFITGDGCNQNCTIQSLYGCYTPDNSTPSTCSKIVDFSINYIYSYKLKDHNSAKIVFLVRPSLQQLSYMNFKRYIQTSLPCTSFDSQYDYSSSALTIFCDYKQNIQKSNQQIKFGFDPSLAYCSPISVFFKPTGVNHQLIINQYVEYNVFIKWVSLILGILALVITFASFIASKPLLALQMLFPIQLTCVILSYFPNVLSSIGSLSQLKYSGGYNNLKQSYSYNTNYIDQSSLIIAEEGNQFVLNLNYMAAVLICTGILTIICKLLTYFLWKQQILQESSVKVQKSNKIILIIKYIQMVLSKKIFAFAGLSIMIPGLFALSTQLQYKSSPIFSNYTTANYNTLAAIVTLIFIFLSLTQCLDSQDSKTLKGYAKHVQQTRIQFFFLSQLFVAMLFTGLITIPFIQYALFVIGIVPLLLYLYQNPYKNKPKFQRITAFICYLMILINAALLLIADLVNSQLINLIIAALILSIILLVEVLTIIRVILDKIIKPKEIKIKMTLDEIQQNERQIREDDCKQSERQDLMKQDYQKMQQLTMKDHQQFDSTRNIKNMNQGKIQDEKQDLEKHESNSDSQLDKQNQLQQIKKKLRADLLQRRGGLKKK